MAFNLNSLLDSAGGFLGIGGDPFSTDIGQKVDNFFLISKGPDFTVTFSPVDIPVFKSIEQLYVCIN